MKEDTTGALPKTLSFGLYEVDQSVVSIGMPKPFFDAPDSFR